MAREKRILIHWSKAHKVKLSACNTFWTRAVLGDNYRGYTLITCKRCQILAEINKREKEGTLA